MQAPGRGLGLGSAWQRWQRLGPWARPQALPTVILGDGGCRPCRGSMPDRECLPDARELGGGAFLSWGWPGSLRKGALSPEECRTLKPLRTEEGLGRASLVGRR